MYCIILTFALIAQQAFAQIELSKAQCGADGSCICRKAKICCCVGSSVTKLPSNLSEHVKILSLFEIGAERIDEHFFEGYPGLEQIIIENSDALRSIDANAFKKLRSLVKLKVSNCQNLKEVTGVLLINNTKALWLIMDNNGLERMPTLEMTEEHLNKIEEINFSHNKIEYLGDGQLRSVEARWLDLSHNHFREIGGHAFANCQISKLYLHDNMNLRRMSMDTFAEIRHIRELDLSRTAISELPVHGLKKLETIELVDTDNLKKLPPILAFTSLKTAKFTYPYHCCLFKHASREVSLNNQQEYSQNIEEIKSRECNVKSKIFTRRRRFIEENNSSEGTDYISEFMKFLTDSQDHFSRYFQNDDFDSTFDGDDVGQTETMNREACMTRAVSEFFASINCTPEPNALNPCENVVGYQFLRWAIWVVWILAILGNIGVWLVLATVHQKRMRVHYFFMANLSTADLLTGVYLGMLAIEDVRTSDEYYNHAVEWQTGVGCQIAGFLSVFASEISIMSMFFIAFEMWYNARYAFYGRRLTERTAYTLMTCAYIIAFTMAFLPIVGVSTYTGTSVCLPLSIEQLHDRIYLMFGLLFNLFAFLGMAVSYILIVKMLKNPEQPSRPEDKAVIMKMAILIGTDMLCWFPTLFFGFTAAINLPLINISVAKIFLVLFYPINSFANPFLYVFFTKVVQKNVKPRAVSLLKRLSLTNLTSEKTCTSLSNFYHLQPQGIQCKFDECQQLLQIASKHSTPRSSNASSYQKTITSCNSSRRSSPRVSFQEEVLNHPAVVPKRKSLTILKQRMSVVPEMSDISEHSGTDEHHDNSKRSTRPSITQLVRCKRNGSAHSVGMDSGRGDSLASEASLGDRILRSICNKKNKNRSKEENGGKPVLFDLELAYPPKKDEVTVDESQHQDVRDYCTVALGDMAIDDLCSQQTVEAET